MTTEPTIVAEDELTRVLRWRHTRLLQGGYSPADAKAVAVCSDVDLHEALKLVRSGCPPEIAARILL